MVILGFIAALVLAGALGSFVTIICLCRPVISVLKKDETKYKIGDKVLFVDTISGSTKTTENVGIIEEIKFKSDGVWYATQKRFNIYDPSETAPSWDCPWKIIKKI